MNFLNYLYKDYNYLRESMQEINKILFSQPHSSIIKGRIIAENVLQEVAKLEGYEWTSSMSQFEKIRKLTSEGILEEDQYDLFENIRLIGNKAAHTNIEKELESALNIHKDVYKIICWFIETYIAYEFNLPLYERPTPDEDKIPEIDEEMVKRLLEKMLKEQQGEHREIKLDANDGLNIQCLVQDLSKLRQSSKEAVENVGEFTEFKRYMHIERDAQKKLHELIFKANESKKSQLILVSGSVGDGKSHIISYFNNKYPEITANFTLHNDATESLEPNKTSVDTLNEVLDDFSDDKIQTSNSKIILAINLGTLNNFIDSEYGERFTLLKKYVYDKKIIETSIEHNNFDEDSSIQFVNFSDYHLFTLKDGKVHSNYIETLISRIADSSEQNIFYNSYKSNCTVCGNNDCCPIKSNYELLSNRKVQKSIVDLLVQCIIKSKIIISTRALINFIYELIVPISYIDDSSPTLKADIYKINNLKYIKSLMPNTIFNHKELSFIFNALNSIDPLDIRNQEVDSFIIEFNNSMKPLYYFEEYLDLPEGYMNKVSKIEFSETEDEKIIHELLKLFIRGYYMCGKGKLFSLNDNVYEDYIESIYFWNKGDKLKLKKLYNSVQEGILKWNGKADKDEINIFMGKKQIKYKISEAIELNPDISNLPKDQDGELKKFLTTLKLRYGNNKLKESFDVDIDFALYRLLIQINNGYRPNRKDKNQFINFIEFINKLQDTGSKDHKIMFTEKNREKNKKYKLEYDSQFEVYRFMEISI